MTFVNNTFFWDYENFDYVKSIVDFGSFFNFIDINFYKIDQSRVGSDGYTFYKYLDEKDEEGYNSGEKFEYRLNSDYFRSFHFSKLEKKNYNILTTGCSYTFGHGLPEECIWPTLIEEKIKLINKNVKVFNLGLPGLGIDAIINNVISFIDKYGVPNVIIALLPDINRSVIYSPNLKKYKLYAPSTNYIQNKKNDENLFFRTINYQIEDRVYQAVNQIKMLEHLCKGYGIDLLWQSWDGNSDKLYDNISFENYVKSEKNHPAYYYESNKIGNSLDLSADKYNKYRKFARDSNHPGIEHQASIANFFYSHLEGKL